jgi:phosphatidylglycerophosphate synthase
MVWWSVIGWLTDFLDGLKARWQKLYGSPAKPTKNTFVLWWREKAGKYLDPIVDIPTGLATGLILWQYYQHSWLIALLLGMTVTRFVLFLIYRLWAWQAKAPGILPPDIAGQSKAWFLATSFVLILLNRQSPLVVGWAETFLGVALLLEGRGIYNQCLAAWRQRQKHKREKRNDHN